jgi:hypothetical protein
MNVYGDSTRRAKHRTNYGLTRCMFRPDHINRANLCTRP